MATHKVSVAIVLSGSTNVRPRYFVFYSFLSRFLKLRTPMGDFAHVVAVVRRRRRAHHM